MLVSVIIPCYNVEQYIAQCLQSLLNQQHKDLQIICVNNNSSDHTLSVLTSNFMLLEIQTECANRPEFHSLSILAQQLGLLSTKYHQE